MGRGSREKQRVARRTVAVAVAMLAALTWTLGVRSGPVGADVLARAPQKASGQKLCATAWALGAKVFLAGHRITEEADDVINNPDFEIAATLDRERSLHHDVQVKVAPFEQELRSCLAAATGACRAGAAKAQRTLKNELKPVIRASKQLLAAPDDTNPAPDPLEWLNTGAAITYGHPDLSDDIRTAAWFGAACVPNDPAAAHPELVSSHTHLITDDSYSDIHVGMSEAQLLETVGGPGLVVFDPAATLQHRTTYYWDGFSYGARATVQLKDGVVTSKSQWGLD
jgi:hypothetical protein